MISYKYNIYHSKKTKYLDKMFRECCFVWNHALALQRRYYRLFGKYIPVGILNIAGWSESIFDVINSKFCGYKNMVEKIKKIKI